MRALVLLLVALTSQAVIAKKYKSGETIALYANKIGPFQNPTETYRFYTLPFCEPHGGAKDKLEDLGEVICSQGPRCIHMCMHSGLYVGSFSS